MVTAITREGVQDPSQLSQRGKEEHYLNRNPPRRRQALNRKRVLNGQKIIKDGEQY